MCRNKNTVFYQSCCIPLLLAAIIAFFSFELASAQDTTETKIEENHINLKVVGSDNSAIHFKIKKTTQLKRLKQAYADRQDVPLTTLRFLFDGQSTY